MLCIKILSKTVLCFKNKCLSSCFVFNIANIKINLILFSFQVCIQIVFVATLTPYQDESRTDILSSKDGLVVGIKMTYPDLISLTP